MCSAGLRDLHKRGVRSGVRDEADIGVRRGEKACPLLVFSKAFYVCWRAAIPMRETAKLREFHLALLPQNAFLN